VGLGDRYVKDMHAQTATQSYFSSPFKQKFYGQQLFQTQTAPTHVLLNATGLTYHHTPPVAYPEIFSGGGSTNSVEDRGQREQGSGGGNSLVRGSAQFANG
jgi:hypothetical protein